jgi:PilZ domain
MAEDNIRNSTRAEMTNGEKSGEKRAGHRLLCSDLVLLVSEKHRAVGILEDISPQGASVQIEVDLPVGGRVEIRVGRSLWQGVIRHCSPYPYGFTIGIEFDLGSRWSPAEYQPRHGLDPRSLLRLNIQ